MRMDNSGKVCPELETEPRRRGVPPNQWESGESDTESLSQERAYQHQLNRRNHNTYSLPVEENFESLKQGGAEEGDETEDLHLYDSLELASNPSTKRNPALLQTEYWDTQMDEREGSQLLSDYAYSDLRCDPNWRSNLKRNGRFVESPQTSVDELYQFPTEENAQSYGDRRRLEIKGRYIVDTSPPVVLTPNVADEKSQPPQCQHPEHDQTPPKNEITQSLPISTRETCENSCDSAGENISRSSKTIEDTHVTETPTNDHQEPRCAKGGAIQKTSTSAPTSSKVQSNKKPQRQEDIVERNKITLGRITSKHGSYVRQHALKQDTPHNIEEVHETLEETTLTENQEDSSDPELTLRHKTQELWVYQISKGKNAQWKEYPNPSEQQQSPAVAVKAEWGDCWSVPIVQAAAVNPLKPQATTSSKPSTPAFHPSLRAPSHPLSSLQQRGRDSTVNSASLHGHPCSPQSEVQVALFTGCQQKTSPGQSAHMSEQWQRTSALHWPSPCEEEEQNWSLDEFLTEPSPQSLSRSPASSGSYVVLPPIGEPLAGEEPVLSPGQTMNTANPSGSYLVQMEKQKELRMRAAYKADEQLKTDLIQRGPHPHYATFEKTKIKRQKLYSNVIREQNKQMSRIPFLLAKDPEGIDNKVPRTKALEYAKTIAKPSVKSQLKQRQNSKTAGVAEHVPHLRDLDVSELTFLRKRHEEEKQAVALLGKADEV